MEKVFRDIEINWDFEDSDEIFYSWGDPRKWDTINLYDGEYFDFLPCSNLLIVLERDNDHLDISAYELGENLIKN